MVVKTQEDASHSTGRYLRQISNLEGVRVGGVLEHPLLRDLLVHTLQDLDLLVGVPARRPAQNNRVLVFAARTLNAKGQSWVTLSLR